MPQTASPRSSTSSTTWSDRRFPVSGDKLRGHLPWITLVALALLIGAFDPTFLMPQSLLGLASDVAALFIMAMGITFVIFTALGIR